MALLFSLSLFDMLKMAIISFILSPLHRKHVDIDINGNNADNDDNYDDDNDDAVADRN